MKHMPGPIALTIYAVIMIACLVIAARLDGSIPLDLL